jgi:hypothetical protein
MNNPPSLSRFSIDLAFIAIQAHIRHDDYDAFGYYVELDERTDEELDALVDSIAAPIIAQIDCTQCANCCRVLDVYLTPEDAETLAQGTFIPLESLMTEKIDQDKAAQVEEWGVFKQQPCSFLKSNLCSVYDYRPESCRAYPALTPDFRWLVHDILDGVGLCPIIYHTIEALQKAMRW